MPALLPLARAPDAVVKPFDPGPVEAGVPSAVVSPFEVVVVDVPPALLMPFPFPADVDATPRAVVTRSVESVGFGSRLPVVRTGEDVGVGVPASDDGALMPRLTAPIVVP